MFSEPLPTPTVEAKPTFESLFKPDVPAEESAPVDEGSVATAEAPASEDAAAVPASETELASAETTPAAEPEPPATE